MPASLSLVLALGLLSPAAPASPAPAASTPAASAPRPLAVTISGGVSLGAYEAGFLYVVVEALKQAPQAEQLKLFTGASAGSANAFFSLVSSCLPPQPDPTRDLAYRAWVERASFERLTSQPRNHPALGALSKEPLSWGIAEVLPIWQAGLPERCDAVLGVSTTRVHSYPVEVLPGFSLPRVEEKFALHIRGQGPGRPPLVENYVSARPTVDQPLLELKRWVDPERQAFSDVEAILNLLLASASFPLAFAPQPLRYCMLPGRPGGRPQALSCELAEHERPFLDGGIFDNNPMRWSDTLAALGLRVHASRLYWRSQQGPDSGTPVDTQLLYLDPGRVAYPRPGPGEDAALPRSVLKLLGGFAASAAQTARAKELYTLAQEREDIRQRVHLSVGRFPKASEPLEAFFGLFERSFREFDFYLGMHDAHQALHAQAKAQPEAAQVLRHLDGLLRREAWLPLRCLQAWLEPSAATDAPPSAACDAPSLQNLRVLAQVAMDRVHKDCAQLPPERIGPQAPRLCVDAAAGAPPRRLPGLPEVPAAAVFARPAEGLFAYVTRRLGEYRFAYTDLGLPASRAAEAPLRIRRKLLALGRRLADAQPSALDQATMNALTRGLVNDIVYEPPHALLYLNGGTELELGTSLWPFARGWGRLSLSLGMKDLNSLLSTQALQLRSSLTAGPELQLLPLTSQGLQPAIGLRAGYQLSTRSAPGKCTAARAHGDNRNCSQPILESTLALGLAELFRVELLVQWYPQRFSFDRRLIEAHVLIGLQLFRR